MSQFSYCPDCGKKGVQLRLRSASEDHLGCKYCDWYTFTSDAPPVSNIDILQRKRHEKAQIIKGKLLGINDVWIIEDNTGS